MKTLSNRKNRSGLYIVLTALFVLTFFASTKAGADVNARGDDGRTAAKMASQNGHKEIIQLLKEAR